MIAWICPEGTRNSDFYNNSMLPFKKGFVYVIEEAKVDTLCVIYRDPGHIITYKADVYRGNVVV